MQLQTVWRVAAACMSLGVLLVALASTPDMLFFLGMAIGGAGFCGVQIAGFTSLADVTATCLERGRGGGFATGVWMAGEKAGLACGPLLAGFGLQYGNFALVSADVRLLIALIPLALATVAVISLGFRN
jgi:MFS family permease